MTFLDESQFLTLLGDLKIFVELKYGGSMDILDNDDGSTVVSAVFNSPLIEVTSSSYIVGAIKHSNYFVIQCKEEGKLEIKLGFHVNRIRLIK